MYKAINKKFKNIKQREVAKKVGITESTLSRIVNNKQTTSKATAYCIVKSINPDSEIHDFFEKVD